MDRCRFSSRASMVRVHFLAGLNGTLELSHRVDTLFKVYFSCIFLKVCSLNEFYGVGVPANNNIFVKKLVCGRPNSQNTS